MPGKYTRYRNSCPTSKTKKRGSGKTEGRFHRVLKKIRHSKYFSFEANLHCYIIDCPPSLVALRKQHPHLTIIVRSSQCGVLFVLLGLIEAGEPRRLLY